MSLQEFKCPSCGGAISFDSATQKLKCPYCDTEFEVDAIKEYNEDLSGFKEEGYSKEASWENSNSYWETDEGMKVYVCESCGGEIITDDTTAATSCPYCGNPVVMKEQLSGDLKPDYVIPFKLDKKAAVNALKEHMSNKKLLPKCFKDENHIDEIKGIYVPFWLFDAESIGSFKFKGTRTRIWSDSDWNYTETSHYSIVRVGGMEFDNIPVDGSEKMPDDLMESLEPFDFSQAMDFKTAYLAGYFADRYDVDALSSNARANDRVRSSTESVIRSTINGYSTLTPEYTGVDIKPGQVKYAMYPVWLLNTTYRGEKFTFAMNGQTGKIAGNMPVDKGQAWLWRGIFTLIFGAAAFLFVTLFGLL